MQLPFSNKIEYTLKQYFEIQKPTYIAFQLIPDTSIRNYNSESIAKTMCNMYKSFYQRFKKDCNHFKIKYNKPFKFSFMMDITKGNVKFYFICPTLYSNLFQEKIRDIWNKITINKLNISEIPTFSKQSLSYQLYYQKEDALSFKIDKRLNQPLNNILNVIDILQNDDRVGIIYNFSPCSQKSWNEHYKITTDKYKNNIPIDKIHGKSYLIKYTVLGIVNVVNDMMNMLNTVIDSLVGNKNITDNLAINEALATSIKNIITDNKMKLSQDTLKKKDSQIISTQMIVLADSKNNDNKQNIIETVCNSYQTLDGDNKLIYKRFKNKNSTSYYTDFKIKNVIENKLSTSECKHLLELPARELLMNNKNIEKVNVLENPVPDELQNGKIYLGKTLYRGNKFNAYLPTNYDKANLPLALLSSQGGGKTTLLANMAKNMIDNNECLIVIDFIKNCELANSIKAITPKEKLIEINCDDINNLQGFGYNEISKKDIEKMSDLERLDIASLQSQQTEAFINAINVDEESRGLTSQMKRVLRASANIVYFYGKQNIGDVIYCLEDHSTRCEYLDKIQNESDTVKSILKREIVTLSELNEKDKNGTVTGTKGGTALKGIFDRINELEADIRTKIMFNKSCDDNINFVDAMNNKKVILIKMPEDVFFSSAIKDMLTTFFCTKTILAIKLRSKQEKPNRCNIIIDELTQTEGAESWIKQTLTQTRKFGGKYIFAFHHMKQLKFQLDDELKGSGASFILLQGCDKAVFHSFEDELLPYTLEDLLNLKQYHALNLIKTNDGWSKFITELPPEPIELKKLRNI
jgi:hypothetical protein